MPQIVVTIDGKTFRMACAEGEEEHLLGLAAAVDRRVGELRSGFGEIGDQRLTVMAAIMAEDELSEAHRRIGELEAEMDALRGQGEGARASAASGREVLAETMNRVAETVERITARLDGRAVR